MYVLLVSTIWIAQIQNIPIVAEVPPDSVAGWLANWTSQQPGPKHRRQRNPTATKILLPFLLSFIPKPQYMNKLLSWQLQNSLRSWWNQWTLPPGKTMFVRTLTHNHTHLILQTMSEFQDVHSHWPPIRNLNPENNLEGLFIKWLI